MKGKRTLSLTPIIVGLFVLLLSDWLYSKSSPPSVTMAQDKASAASVSPQTAQLPPEEKDVFIDEDLKEEKIQGQWMIASKPDSDQLNDPATPVVVKAVATYSGQGKYRGLTKIRKVEVQNRSDRFTQSLMLRWFIVNVENADPILLEGLTPLFDARIEPSTTQIVDIPHIFFNRVIKPLRKEGELNGIFYIVVGVQEVHFSDGPTWKRSEEVADFNPSLRFKRQSAPLTSPFTFFEKHYSVSPC